MDYCGASHLLAIYIGIHSAYAACIVSQLSAVLAKVILLSFAG